jgi:hypothetical protein
MVLGHFEEAMAERTNLKSQNFLGPPVECRNNIPKPCSCISLFLATKADDNYARSKHAGSQVHYSV